MLVVWEYNFEDEQRSEGYVIAEMFDNGASSRHRRFEFDDEFNAVVGDLQAGIPFDTVFVKDYGHLCLMG